MKKKTLMAVWTEGFAYCLNSKIISKASKYPDCPDAIIRLIAKYKTNRMKNFLL